MTLKELQHWVEDDWKHNSKSRPEVYLQLIYLFEELGEMAEAIRKLNKEKDRKAVETDLAGEMADVLISLTTIANHFDIDLTTAVAEAQAKITARHEEGY